GREHAEMFKKGFEGSGGKVVAEIFAPLGTADFGTYVTQIGRAGSDADVVYIVYSGIDAIRFVKAYAEYGLKDKLTLANWGATLDGKSGLGAMGDAALGAYEIGTYIPSRDFPRHRRFVEAAEPQLGYRAPRGQ